MGRVNVSPELVHIVVASLAAVFLILNASKERKSKRMLLKLFVAGFWSGFALMLFLIHDKLLIRLYFGFITGVLTGVIMMIRIPQAWRYVEQKTEEKSIGLDDESNDKSI